jgi:hypothetical protein
MTVLRDWCTSPSATANPPFQSQQAQLESGVRGNVPAPFGAGERLQSPTYRYLGGSNPSRLPDSEKSLFTWLLSRMFFDTPPSAGLPASPAPQPHSCLWIECTFFLPEKGLYTLSS